MSDDLNAARQRVKGPLHAALHTLEARIPNLPGDCHCNLLAEVALDALMPVLADLTAAAEARGYDRAIANLRTIAADLDEYLESDEITDPIGRLETLQIRLAELLKDQP